MTETLPCEMCGRPVKVADEIVDDVKDDPKLMVGCGACEGMQELPDDVPVCDHHDCKEPAPFTINTADGEIYRCRECLIIDLVEKQWFVFYNSVIHDE